MFADAQVPAGSSFAYDTARSALADQISLISSHDAKAGQLLSVFGILSGLIFGVGPLKDAPPRFVVLTVGVLLVSALLALIALHPGKWKTAPHVVKLAEVRKGSEDVLKEKFLGNVLEAFEINRRRLERKARFIQWSGIGLLLEVVLLGIFVIDAAAVS